MSNIQRRLGKRQQQYDTEYSHEPRHKRRRTEPHQSLHPYESSQGSPPTFRGERNRHTRGGHHSSTLRGDHRTGHKHGTHHGSWHDRNDMPHGGSTRRSSLTPHVGDHVSSHSSGAHFAGPSSPHGGSTRRSSLTPGVSPHSSGRHFAGSQASHGSFPHHVHASSPESSQPLSSAHHGSRMPHYHSTQRRDYGSHNAQSNVRSRANPRPGAIKYLSAREIEALARSNSSERVMADVNGNEAGFLAAFQHDKFCKDPAMMRHLIKLLHLLANSDDIERIAPRILARILSADGSYALFIMKLDLFIKEMVTETRGNVKRDNSNYLRYLLEIGSRTIEVIPETILSVFPLQVLRNTIESLVQRGESLNTLEQMVKQLDEEFKLARERQAISCSEAENANAAQPPECFADVTILPSLSEVHSSDDKIFLRKNLVQGSYSSLDHYLDVQYCLLREDFVRPLRHGIQHYCTPGAAKSSQDIRIYEQVRVLNPVCLFSGVGFEIQFDISRLRRVNWEHSRRLIYGSLLCLSTDKFKHSMMFATVVKRDVSLLQEGRLIIKFEGESSGFQASPNQVFTMVESMAYFEAYRHILEKLQESLAMQNQIPFKSYIVGSRNSIRLPSYLSGRRQKFDLSKILNEKSMNQVQICDESSWPAAEATCLDQSQLEALKMALTKEVSVIQGPPGTGKTFIGLKIVEAFLRNRSVWDRNKAAPILVVCYTNHALDQFLEGIQALRITEQRTPSIVRIGGRCKSDKLTGCILRNKIQEYQARNVLRRDLVAKRGQCYNMVMQQRKLLTKVHKSGCHSNGVHVLELNDLKEVMKDEHYQQLLPVGECGVPGNEVGVWLKLGQYQSEITGDEQEDVMESVDEGDTCIQVDNEAKMIEEDRILEGEEIGFLDLEAVSPTSREQTSQTDWKSGSASKPTGFNTKIMSEKEARRVRDVWMIPVKRRWELYNFWCLEYAKICADRYEQACTAYTRASREVEKDVLRDCDVVGMTTTGAAKHHHLLKRIHPKIVIFEEAAEIFEAHIVTSLAPSVQQLVLIGDHKQLQPKPNCYDLEVHYNLAVSLFERLITNGFPYVSLTVQHRMRPEISSLIHPSVYENLTDHDSVEKYECIQGIAKDVFFINHDQPEVENQGSDITTHVNVFEADYLVSLCRYLLKQGYQPGAITILTMYRGQLLELKRKMRRKDFEGVRVAAVDDFQGEENDIILLSLVRSNPEQNIGFLSISNRICVSLSRAKKGFYIIGNLSMLRDKNKTLWPQIVDVLEQNVWVGTGLPLYCRVHSERKVFAEKPEDFLKCPEGGCDRPCGETLACGHRCTRICHTNDLTHANSKCLEPCPKPLPCGHKCRHKCHECSSSCKPCVEVVKKVMSSCHHKTTISVKCSESNSINYACPLKCGKRLNCGHVCRRKCSELCTVKCTAMATKDLPCGHKVEAECYLAADQIECKEKCGALLECGHHCVGTCSDCHLGRLHVRCQQNCGRQLVCGHTCGFPCASTCPPCVRMCNNFCMHSHCPKKCYELCVPCMEPCEWQCRHHKCTQPCGHLCDRPPCDEPCDKKLPCGHDCIGLCGEHCPDLCRVCNQKEVNDQLEFLGSDDDAEEAHFIKLDDCGHLFEFKSLDKWVGTNKGKGLIQFPVCPQCTTPIRKSLRYGNQVKKVLQDVDGIKRKQIVPKDEILDQFQTLEAAARKSQTSEFLSTTREISKSLCQASLHPYRIRTLSFQISTLANVFKIKEIATTIDRELASGLKSKHVICDTNSIMKRLEVIKAFLMQDFLSQHQMSDVSSEIYRISCVTKLCDLLCKLHVNQRTPTSDDEQVMAEVVQQLHTAGWKGEKLSEKHEHSIMNLIQRLSRTYQVNGITKQEKVAIVRAMGFKQGHWFKCPNGHIYCIGECGGAMQQSKCPECGAAIGGQRHTLAAGNLHAPEMDGSRHAAWSETANLANFDLQQLR